MEPKELARSEGIVSIVLEEEHRREDYPKQHWRDDEKPTFASQCPGITVSTSLLEGMPED